MDCIMDYFLVNTACRLATTGGAIIWILVFFRPCHWNSYEENSVAIQKSRGTWSSNKGKQHDKPRFSACPAHKTTTFMNTCVTNIYHVYRMWRMKYLACFDLTLESKIGHPDRCPSNGRLDGMHHFDGLVKGCSNSSALAIELLQSCTKPSVLF